MANRLKRGIIVVFLANILNLGLSVIRNLILPHYLSVDTYAGIKLSQLYISYIGFVFVDENYRGRRVSEKLIKHVIIYAKNAGFDNIYIMSGETGFYEKRRLFVDLLETCS